MRRCTPLLTSTSRTTPAPLSALRRSWLRSRLSEPKDSAICGSRPGVAEACSGCFVFPHNEGSDNLSSDAVLEEYEGVLERARISDDYLDQSPRYELFDPSTVATSLIGR